MKKAFTLIELIVVVMIIAILVAVALPMCSKPLQLPVDAVQINEQTNPNDGCHYRLFSSQSTGQRYEKSDCDGHVSLISDDDN